MTIAEPASRERRSKPAASAESRAPGVRWGRRARAGRARAAPLAPWGAATEKAHASLQRRRTAVPPRPLAPRAHRGKSAAPRASACVTQRRALRGAAMPVEPACSTSRSRRQPRAGPRALCARRAVWDRPARRRRARVSARLRPVPPAVATRRGRACQQLPGICTDAVCSYATLPDGTSCSSGNGSVCDVCAGGSCTGTLVCPGGGTCDNVIGCPP